MQGWVKFVILNFIRFFSQDVKLKFELKLQEEEFIELSKFTDINKVEANNFFTIYFYKCWTNNSHQNYIFFYTAPQNDHQNKFIPIFFFNPM